jgi:hypothetical protein
MTGPQSSSSWSRHRRPPQRPRGPYTSADQATVLLSGRIEYVDAGGNPVPLQEGRGEAPFRFFTSQTDRLDPGMETPQNIEVPFPVAAVEAKNLGRVRLGLTHIPTPYKHETASIPVAMEG